MAFGSPREALLRIAQARLRLAVYCQARDVSLASR